MVSNFESREILVSYGILKNREGPNVLKTFADIGIPFPLFEGPIEQASNYSGLGECSLCGHDQRHCFELGIGRYIVVDCQTCDTANGLHVVNRNGVPCRQCHTFVPFPDFPAEKINACYECLRLGKAAISKDTELGMISWEQALEGITHGTPVLNRSDFEMVPKEDGWVGARLPREQMFELLRTPNYLSIQGEVWQFCCQQPMIYLGRWRQNEFNDHASDGNGHGLFQQTVQRNFPVLWEDLSRDVIQVYVFRCSRCDRLTAHWDMW